MPRVGRPRKPIEQRKAEGTLRPDRHGAAPLLIGGRTKPKPSPYLTTAQKREFRRFVREYDRDGNLLDAADGPMIDIWAIEASVVVECNKALESGLTHEVVRGGKDGREERIVTELSPLLKAREDALSKLRLLCVEFGIGPVARATLAARGVQGKKPSQALPGVGAQPTPLKVAGSG